MSADAYLDAVLDLWAEDRRESTCRLCGDSMSPLLCCGDRITIAHGPPRVRLGDIVVFRKGRNFVAHRVVGHLHRRGGIAVLTKGDNAGALDEPVEPRQIVGKVVAVERARGRVCLDRPSARLAARALALVSRGSIDDPFPASPALLLMRALRRLRRHLLPRALRVRRLVFRALGGLKVVRRPPVRSRPTHSGKAMAHGSEESST